MTTLISNRYNQVTPTQITENGASVSTPIYISPTTDQSKQLLNAFREVVRKQRLEMGYSQQPVSKGGLQVETAIKPPMTKAENDLGMTEDALRYALFQRQGIAERLIVKLSQITGVEIITRQSIEATITAWLDHLYGAKQVEPKTTRQRKTSTSK